MIIKLCALNYKIEVLLYKNCKTWFEYILS